jgi:hypothetical protein
MTAVYEKHTQEFIDFVKTFKNDPDINRIPLPDSVRRETGINHNLSYIPVADAATRAIFAPNTWDKEEEVKNDPTVPFPDLTKLAEEYRKTYLEQVEETPEEKEEEAK